MNPLAARSALHTDIVYILICLLSLQLDFIGSDNQGFARPHQLCILCQLQPSVEFDCVGIIRRNSQDLGCQERYMTNAKRSSTNL
jgi:hypothetical protein